MTLSLRALNNMTDPKHTAKITQESVKKKTVKVKTVTWSNLYLDLKPIMIIKKIVFSVLEKKTTECTTSLYTFLLDKCGQRK